VKKEETEMDNEREDATEKAEMMEGEREESEVG